MKYGIVKELGDGHILWFEPLTDEMDGFVVRTGDGSMVRLFLEVKFNPVNQE